jgi:hypothetical protein
MDAHANNAYGKLTNSPGLAGTSAVLESGGAELPAVPFNATLIDITNPFPTARPEIVRVTNVAGNTCTIERAQEGTVARNLLAGMYLVNTATKKTFEDIEKRISPSVSKTGRVYVSKDASASDANDGASWQTAKATIKAAIEALPLSPEGGRVGVVMLGFGVFEENSTGRVVTAGHCFEESPYVEVPGATAEDVGSFLITLKEKTPEGARVKEVVEGELTRTGEGTKASPFVYKMNAGNKKYVVLGGGFGLGETRNTGFDGAETVFIAKAAILLPTGVAIEGVGPLSGYHGGESVGGGSKILDNGTGITIGVESGTGEKNEVGNQTLSGGGALRQLVVEGNQENLYGFYVACNYNTDFRNVAFINHGIAGTVIGSKAAVSFKMDHVDFRLNGIRALAYAAGTTYKKGERASEAGLTYELTVATAKGVTPAGNPGSWKQVLYPVQWSGGLRVPGAPNQGNLDTVRCLGNFGIGAELVGVATKDCEFSKTEATERLTSGYGLVSGGYGTTGSVTMFAGWCENNAKAAVIGGGIFIGTTFQGHNREECAIKTSGGRVIAIGCSTFSHLNAFIEEGSGEEQIQVFGITSTGSGAETVAVKRNKIENPNITMAEASGYAHTK